MTYAAKSVLAAVVLLAVTAHAAEKQTLANAKVGDWVEYKQTVDANGRSMEMSTKQAVTAKDEKSITLKSQMTVMGRELPGGEIKIPLDQEYNPAGGAKGSAKMEETETGEETLTAGGKEYKCRWVKVKGTTEGRGGKEVPFEGKVWICKDVPLGGMVKMDGKADGNTFKKELTGCGQGK
ncbi:MAG: hypothetical protein HY291_07770 [Planctomycetes bacterium]|nr:hypothetical protein [Planctomycetota bacterium]